MKSILILLTLLLCVSVFAQDSQTSSPQSAANHNPFYVEPWYFLNFGGPEWSEHNYLEKENCSSPTDTAFLYNFGFDIPPNMVVDGIKLMMIKSSSDEDFVQDKFIGLGYDEFALTNNKADSGMWSTSPETFFYGGNSDTWGSNLTSEIVNDSLFGLMISVFPSAWCVSAWIDDLEVTLSYSPAAVGVEEQKRNEISWSIFPNPASEKLTIISTDGSSIHELQLFDLFGNKVYENQHIEQRTIIDVSSFSGGLYLTKIIKADGLIETKWFVVE